MLHEYCDELKGSVPVSGTPSTTTWTAPVDNPSVLMAVAGFENSSAKPSAEEYVRNLM